MEESHVQIHLDNLDKLVAQNASDLLRFRIICIKYTRKKHTRAQKFARIKLIPNYDSPNYRNIPVRPKIYGKTLHAT